ncbi:MAG: glycosyltransferase [Actinomycetota bacterium]
MSFTLSFDHLLRLADGTGVLEHSRGATPRRECGYCVDDAARALVVISRQADPSPPVARLGECCLSFLAHAQTADGRFHNRLSYDRRWEDEPGLGDCWGRALWGLGTAAARHRDPWVREDAARGFAAGARCRSGWQRAMAFAVLGATELLAVRPSDAVAQSLLGDAAEMLARPTRKAWPWPEGRLAYANALLPEALICAGDILGDEALLSDGLALLGWLLETETHDGHLSVTPVGGWGPEEARPGFDQQPIEVAALADACARAFRLTKDARWSDGIERAGDWFLGHNDAATPMWDAATGGGFDGLEPAGRNANQGAESTLAALSTLQQAGWIAAGAQ